MGLFDKLRGMVGGKAPDSAQASAAAAAASQTPDDDTVAFNESFNRRYEFWRGVGDLEDDVITHLISPSFTGGPSWPTTRQAYRVVRRPSGAIVIATDGLSDPFSGVSGSGNGFEMELFVETADIAPELIGGPGDVSPLSRSWAFELVSHVAGTVAGAGGIVPQLDRYGVLSMELPGVSQSSSIAVQIPASYVTADDALGILIGAPAPDFPTSIEGMPLSPVRVVPIVVVTARELELLRAGGAKARTDVAAELGAGPFGWRSSLGRGQ
jgi:hypothetical protein